MGLDHDHTNPTTLAGDPKKPKLAGSVYLNNTTYAGCDIQVLIKINRGNVNDIGTRIDPQEIVTMYTSQLERNRRNLSKINTRLADQLPGSDTYLRLLQRKNRLMKDTFESSQNLQIASKDAADIAKARPSTITKTLAEVQTLSISTFRDKRAVRRCGTVYPAGFTRGPREIAGSLIFTVFDKHVLYEFLEAHPTDFEASSVTSAVMDQLPPVDILISFANEYGAISRMDIYGVEFVSEGQTMSIEDLITENTVNFVARDFDPMRRVGKRQIDSVSNQLQKGIAKSASSLIFEEDYQKYKNDSSFGRFTRRRNPFI